MPLLKRHLNLSQRMTQELGREIVCGVYDKRASLPTEAELCGTFGVSRSAVREAVKMLSAKGLITSKPRQGIRLQSQEQWNIFDADLLRWSLESNPSMKLLKEFLQMRIAIEPEAATLAARFATPERLDDIARALERMADSARDPEAALEADIAFHVSILYASENRFYIRLRDFIQTALRVSIRYTTPIKGDHAAIVREHAQVYDAIRARDPELARHLMRLLVDEALSYVERELNRQAEDLEA